MVDDELVVDNEVDEDVNHFSWEGIYARPWEAVVEAADGSLAAAGSSRKRSRVGARDVQLGVKRGVLRAIFLIVDASRAASEADPDMKPTRLAAMVESASRFVSDFFEQNPISTLAVLATSDGRARLLTEPSCNPRQHLQALTQLGEDGGRSCGSGEASLQNVLELARESLHSVPSFTSREVVLLSASLSSCDPGDILTTVASLQRDKLRCSIFSLQAEVFICRKIATETGGEYGVPTSAEHLSELMLALVPPRPTTQGGPMPSHSLIRVGFPSRQQLAAPTLGYAPGADAKTGAKMCEAPYRCPQCQAAHTELPTQCPICQLKLMSSVELTKTYHHLFPVPAFVEAKRPRASSGSGSETGGGVKRDGGGGGGGASGSTVHADKTRDLEAGPPSGHCYGCAERLPAAALRSGGQRLLEAEDHDAFAAGFECPGCLRLYCASCDELIHGVLRACPGCELRA